MDSNLAEDRSKLYTYADYLTWDDGQRWELIYGRPYLMAQPSPEHQKINKLLLRHMDLYFEGKPCEAYMPIDVRLFPQGDDSDYVLVQPDISVICQPDQLDRRGCKGAPTLVVEILSPSTASHDFVRKMHVYREAGVNADKLYTIALNARCNKAAVACDKSSGAIGGCVTNACSAA